MITIKSKKVRDKFNKLHLEVAEYYGVEDAFDTTAEMSFIIPSRIGFSGYSNLNTLRDEYFTYLSVHFPWLLPFYIIRNGTESIEIKKILLRDINNIIETIDNNKGNK